MARVTGPTAEVFTTTPGDVRQIGTFGQASNDAPAVVPASVAKEFASLPGFRVGKAPQEPEAWHSEGGSVYHDEEACSLGNNIEPENRRMGRGGLKRCAECRKLTRKGQEE
jgi:hypothetical protein